MFNSNSDHGQLREYFVSISLMIASGMSLHRFVTVLKGFFISLGDTEDHIYLAEGFREFKMKFPTWNKVFLSLVSKEEIDSYLVEFMIFMNECFPIFWDKKEFND